MKSKNITRQLGRKLVSVIQRACGILPAARKISSEPAVMGYILLTAHRAQIFLAAAALALLLIMPPILDFGLRTIFPEIKSKKLFGLVERKKQNPARKRTANWIMFTLCVICAGETLLLVWLYIPKGMAKTLIRAKELEYDGDTHASNQPARSLRSYRKAFRLSLDRDHKIQLAAKIEELVLPFNHAGRPLTNINIPNAGTFLDCHKNDCGGGIRSESGMESTRIGPNDRYILGDELGRGGMGIVYEAWDNALDRKVAMKKLPRTLTDDREYISRFEREAKTLARLTHRAILQIYDLFVGQGDFWMALEYVKGGDLAEYLFEHKPLPIADAVMMTHRIADGMAYAHRQAIIHRDLKPANILLAENSMPKISDFGLAKIPVSSELTQEGTILGSPRYMSPEQATGGVVDERSDIYALGIMLYEMVTGQTPFDGDTAQILSKHITQPPPPPREWSPEIPEKLENLILEMLVKEAEERIQKMSIVADILDTILLKQKTMR